MKNPTIFKFRAEFPGDAQKAIALLPDGVEVMRFDQAECTPFSEGTVTIGLTGMDLNDVRRWLAKVPDGHVMYETVALEPNYTGKRAYKDVEEIIALEKDAGANDNDVAPRQCPGRDDAMIRLFGSKTGGERAFGQEVDRVLSTMGVSLREISEWSLEATLLDDKTEAARLAGDEVRRSALAEAMWNMVQHRDMFLSALGCMMVENTGVIMGDFDSLERRACARWTHEQAINAVTKEDSI